MRGEPMPDLTIRGGDGLVSLAGKLDTIGRQGLAPAMESGLMLATTPLVAAARRNAEAVLPKRGGYGREVADSPITVIPLHRTDTAAVKITALGHDPRLDTQGRLRHPVYGNRNVWRQQKVPAGWFTAAMLRGADTARQAVLRAVDRVLDLI